MKVGAAGWTGGGAVVEGVAIAEHGWITEVDHFGFADMRTFKQRYLVADKHWQRNGGSILFYTGNEGDIVWFCNNTGFMWDVAEELKAMLVFAEHRYYGESLPFGQDSFKIILFIVYENTVAVFRHIRRGHWISLQMVVSHHVVAGI